VSRMKTETCAHTVVSHSGPLKPLPSGGRTGGLAGLGTYIFPRRFSRRGGRQAPWTAARGGGAYHDQSRAEYRPGEEQNSVRRTGREEELKLIERSGFVKTLKRNHSIIVCTRFNSILCRVRRCKCKCKCKKWTADLTHPTASTNHRRAAAMFGPTIGIDTWFAVYRSVCLHHPTSFFTHVCNAKMLWLAGHTCPRQLASERSNTCDDERPTTMAAFWLFPKRSDPQHSSKGEKKRKKKKEGRKRA